MSSLIWEFSFCIFNICLTGVVVRTKVPTGTAGEQEVRSEHTLVS